MKRSVPKITRPELKGVAARGRLFRRIDQLVRKHSVVWIGAPAGSGKTTLAASWLAARRRPCLWYQMDPGDADPATFFYYLREAVERLGRRRRERLPLLTPEYALGLSVYARNFLAGVGLRLPTSAVIVLDNYQDFPSGAPLQSLLPPALSALPEGVHVLVLSRSAPPPPFARLVTENAIGLLDADELTLTDEETRAVVRVRVGKPLTPTAALELQTRTGGWMAATVLLLEAPTRALPARRGVETAPQQVLFDYFASEIFDRAPAETQKLLLATALLPEVSVPSAQAVAGEPRAAEILADLVARNYFTLRLAGDEPRYRFHPLFREFLLTRAHASFSAAGLSELRLIGARKLDETGRWEDAARLLVEAGAWHDLGTIIAGHAPELLRQGRSRMLEEWLRAIPAEVLAGAPWLLYWLGVAALAVDVAESRSRFEAAFRLFASRDDASGSCLSWCGIVDTYTYELGDFTPLDRWISEGEALLERHPRFTSPELESRFTYSMFCALMFRPSGHPQLPVWESRARAIALGSGDAFLRASLSGHLVWHHCWWVGDQAKAGVIVDQLRDSVRLARAGPFFESTWYWAEAAHCHATASLERCSALAEEGLRAAERTGIHIFDFWLSLHGCWSALSTEDFASAGDYLRRMAPVVGTLRRADIGSYQATLGWKALCEADFSLALQQQQTAFELFREADFQLGIAASKMFMSEPLIELGHMDKARSCLEEGYRLAVQIGSQTCLYLYWLFDALRTLRRGDPDSARASMRQHLSIAKETGILNHVGWRSVIMSELYAMALEAGIEVELVQSQIRRRKLVPPSSSRDIESWPWPLRVRTLGRFELCRDGEPHAFGPRPPRKPLELLQALVALGGQGIREDKLVDCLWPEAEGDAGQHAIETTLHRLRRILASPGIIAQSGRTISLDQQSCWTDLRALQGRLTTAFTALGGAHVDPAGVQKDVQHVLELYRGPLLPALDSEWACDARERLRAQVGRFLRMAVQRLQAAGEATAAEEVARRGLVADPELRIEMTSDE